MTDLKPCPFCGGDARYRPDHTVEAVHSVSCQSCDAHLSEFSIEGDCRIRWNTRPGEERAHVAGWNAALEAAAVALNSAGWHQSSPDDVKWSAIEAQTEYVMDVVLALREEPK